jgi:hypothetical protein
MQLLEDHSYMLNSSLMEARLRGVRIEEAISTLFVYLFIYLAVLGFELRALHLLYHFAQVLYHLSQAFSPFVLAILEIGSHFLPRQAWTTILLFLHFLYSLE